MKNKRILIAALLATIVILPGVFAYPGTESGIKIGYVDFREVFSQYERATRAVEEFGKEIEREQQRISALEAGITQEQAEFEQKKDLMRPEERARREAALREKRQEFSREWSRINASLDERRKQLEEKLTDEIKQRIYKYGEKKGFTVILDSRLILYGQPVINVTGEIITFLNKGASE